MRKMHVKISNGRMVHIDLTLASNVTNVILDQFSKNSPEEQEETQASLAQLQDQFRNNPLLIIIMESHQVIRWVFFYDDENYIK